MRKVHIPLPLPRILSIYLSHRTDFLGDTSDITIPSTFTSHASYLSLSYLISSQQSLNVAIFPSSTSDWPLLDTLLLVILSPLFTLACIYILLILRRRVQRKKELAPLSVVKSLPHRKWTREKDHNGGGTGGATGEVARTESSMNNSESSVLPDAGYGTATTPRRVRILECVICLEDFVEGDVVITLPCNHEFHEVCMYSPLPLPLPPLFPRSWTVLNSSTPWLTTRRRLCPICKRDIIVKEPDEEDVGERSPLLMNHNGVVEDWRNDAAGSV